jgi:hypothetical protein
MPARSRHDLQGLPPHAADQRDAHEVVTHAVERRRNQPFDPIRRVHQGP